VATGSQALEIKSGNDKVGVQVYGQLNRALMYADDGNESKLFHVDNDNSSTRVGLKGKVAANESLTIGTVFEVEWQANASNEVSMKTETISGEFRERHVDIYFDFKNIGKFSLGKGHMASDTVSEVDLSDTKLIGSSDVADVGGRFLFYDAGQQASSEEEQAPGLMVIDVFNNMDGLSRKNRLRYDTPSFGGFSLATAVGEKEMFDLSLNYSGEFSGTKVKAAVAYSDPNSSYTTINGSASVLFPFGLNLTVAGGTRDLDTMPANGDDPQFMYGKIGYICKELVSVGSTALSVDYGVYENIKKQNIGQEGTVMGVQVVQQITAYSTELYAAYRIFAVEDNTAADYEDISFAIAGVRLRF
jgi:predicted porin